MLGKELLYHRDLSFAEKTYIRVFGVPISGLRIRARRILPLITSKYKTILDVGSGTGVFTFAIAKRNPMSRITGIDIEEELVKSDQIIAEKMGLTNCFFEVQDALMMPYQEEFDLVLSVDNLEHILDDVGAM